MIEHHDLQVLPLDLEICIRATQLPPVHHDLCDRMIIATALIRQLVVVTVDPMFRNYDIDTIE